MKDIVFVKGKILFKTGNHLVKELVAHATDNWQKEAREIIEKDLIVTDEDTLMPYDIYCASEEIGTTGRNVVYGIQPPEHVIRIFKDEIDNLKRLESQKISTELAPV